ncbi:MFS general substrate transporter [Penicillium taxi]|uniref:MFS general substrate transporter n=1 Tax=Penicillium taxi TaxID=168475 RepID=UPI00254518FD|nr:MFS general substrate transporter [Penicillium taxi]KAJ5907794.1 MFS general substrate transporter [Penicillium taxi]
MTEATDHEKPPGNTDAEAKILRKKALSPSIFSRPKKIAIIILVFSMTFIGPIGAGIYYPSLAPLAKDFHVSPNQISFTLTAYMLCQAVFPLLIAGMSDERGRRPVLIVSLVVCIAINIGLAQQTTYVGLLVLRCLQSCGSSSVSIVSMAILHDILLPTERKDFRVYTSVGYSIAPAVSPLIGGLLSQFFGWSSIFYFLATVAGVVLILVTIVLPETCRGQVGNGSVPPKRWNRPIMELLWPPSSPPPEYDTCIPLKPRSTILQTIQIAFRKQIFLLIIFQAILFGGSIAIIVTIPVVFTARFHFNVLEVGATHLSYAIGGFTSRWIFGPLMAANTRRHKRLAGVGKETQFGEPIVFHKERARLQVALPTVYLGSAFVVAYGWALHYEMHVVCPIVILFFLGNTLTGARTQLAGLVSSLHLHQPASTSAASNFFRFLCGAGATAAVIPMIKAVGIGWMGTMIALIYLKASSLLWVVYAYGHKWRPAGIQISSSDK